MSSGTKTSHFPRKPSIQCEYLEEPLLQFAGDGRHIDPKLGILRFGPKSYRPAKCRAIKLWAELEALVRVWAQKFDEVWVIAGPVFGRSPKRTHTGRVAVPRAFYKIIIRKDGDSVKTLAFKIPHNAPRKSKLAVVGPRFSTAKTSTDGSSTSAMKAPTTTAPSRSGTAS